MLFCTEKCILDERKKSREKGRIRRAETLGMRNNVFEIFEEETHEKSNTDKNFVKSEIHHQMLNCFDLVATEAVYHKNCHKEFFKQIRNR